MKKAMNRIPFSAHNPYRSVRPATTKILFLSIEGAVTEYEYFKHLSDIFDGVKGKITIIPTTEDEVETASKIRTPDQNMLLSKVRPLQLAQRFEPYKQSHDHIFQFAMHPEDEFWIVTDVDENWGLWSREWSEMEKLCKEKGYRYVVSNPFFEFWLLLHHDEPNDDDRKYAVTDTHQYQKTDHFKTRLSELGAPIQHKHIREKDYTEVNVRTATKRARELHTDGDPNPHYLATTVYKITEKVIEIADNGIETE